MRNHLLISTVSLLLFNGSVKAEELTTEGWQKKVDTYGETQKIITLKNTYVSNGAIIKTTITQVQKDNEWHWIQAFHIDDANGKQKDICWNVVKGKDHKVVRWYIAPNNAQHVVIGIGDSEDVDEGIKEGESYMKIRNFGDNPIVYLFKRSELGVFEYSGVIDNPDF